jgi:hypothetical protein
MSGLFRFLRRRSTDGLKPQLKLEALSREPDQYVHIPVRLKKYAVRPNRFPDTAKKIRCYGA